MSEFIDDAAVESENDDEEDDFGGPPTKKKKTKRIASSDEDEDEEDDEREIEKEMKGFVVSGDEDDDAPAKSDEDKSNASDDSDAELSEEDHDLIQENLGEEAAPRTQRARIDDDDEDETDDRTRIQNTLFDENEDDVASVRPTAAAAPAAADDDDRSSVSDASERSFIVDDADERSRQRSTKKRARNADVEESALGEAREIFGVGFDLGDIYGDQESGEEADSDEAGSIIDDETGQPRKSRRKKKQLKKTLLQTIEPSEIERGFLSDRDQRIQTEDLPERFQLRSFPVVEGEEGELLQEADWVWRNCFTKIPNSLQPEIESSLKKQESASTIVPKIHKALDFIRNQHFEVPFIAFYRKEYVQPDLNIGDLWRIYQFDEKWCQMQFRRKELAELMRRMQAYQMDLYTADDNEPIPEDVRLIEEDRDIVPIWQSDSMETLSDVRAHFHLYYGSELAKMYAWERRKSAQKAAADAEAVGDTVDDEALLADLAAVGFKHASRSDPYSVCVAAGLNGLAMKFGLSAQQFGENLAENYEKNHVEQYKVDPYETATDYITRCFDTPESVIKGAQYIVSKQFAYEPSVRKYIREQYYARAVVQVRPTKKGRTEIDENHPIFTEKYLKDKLIADLSRDEFLKLVQAEEAQLITMEISPDKRGADVGDSDPRNKPLLEVIKELQYYYKDEFSDSVQQWNTVRAGVLELCLHKFLYPLFAKELRLKLIQEAKDYVVRECCQKLYDYLKVAPYHVDTPAADDDDSFGVRILGIAFSSERDQAAFCALVDGDGELLDHIRLPHLMKRKNSRVRNEANLKGADLETLRRFLSKRKPHVVALAGESLDALHIRSDVQGLVEGMMESGEIDYPIPIEIVDNELAKVYMNCKVADSDFPDLPFMLRQAISVGRRLQDPLAEFCQMFTPDEEILCLTYHPLQALVSKDDLVDALQLEFINRVNEVGVDINRGMEHQHLSPMLQFVGGLGPRKAAYLIKVLKQNDNLLENRMKLVTMCNMGHKVFMNCSGFIKIDTTKVSDRTDAYVELLDGTRIHSETYEWARKMAIDALEYDDTGADEVNPSTAVAEILETPDRLKDLDLDAFAEELQRQSFGDKHITLYDIRAELNNRYKDLREQYKSPEPMPLFNILTKETPATFNVGKLVMGRVMHVVYRRPRAAEQQGPDQPQPTRSEATGLWQCPHCMKCDFPELSEVWTHTDSNECPGQAVGVKVRLENGIAGFIPTKYISDKQVDNPADRVRPQQPIYCRVLKVDVERFQAELSSRSSDLADREGQFKPAKDMYYDFTTEEDDKRQEETARASLEKHQYVKRVIAHPSFHNVNFKESEKMLANMDMGEVVIRPSSKAPDHLTATWKVVEGVYQHIDVKEQNKEKPFTLGKSLWIGEEEFEDLDEIIARHIQPMAGHVRDILSYKYFFDPGPGDRNKAIVQERLIDEKALTPKRIPYMLMPIKEFPGKFLLSYLPREKVRHEYVSVTPDGYRFRQQVFGNLGALFRWFKEHFRDPLPGMGGATPSHSATPFDAQSQYAGGGSTHGGGTAAPMPSFDAMSAQHLWPGPPPMMPPPLYPPPMGAYQNHTMWGEERSSAALAATDEGNSSSGGGTGRKRVAAAAQDWAATARNWANQRANRSDSGTPRHDQRTPR